jgi:hypothetical protein
MEQFGILSLRGSMMPVGEMPIETQQIPTKFSRKQGQGYVAVVENKTQIRSQKEG